MHKSDSAWAFETNLRFGKVNKHTDKTNEGCLIHKCA